MGEDFLFWASVILVVLFVALIAIKPLRELTFKMLGAKTPWGLAFSLGAPILHAHLIVLKNFRPRKVVYPTLENTRKSTTVVE